MLLRCYVYRLILAIISFLKADYLLIQLDIFYSEVLYTKYVELSITFITGEHFHTTTYVREHATYCLAVRNLLARKYDKTL